MSDNDKDTGTVDIADMAGNQPTPVLPAIADIDPATLVHIDALCEAMDRECQVAMMPSSSGVGTWLDDFRGLWLQRARDGLPLPQRWCTGAMAATVDERLADFGTTDWRKAYPDVARELLENQRKNPVYTGISGYYAGQFTS